MNQLPPPGVRPDYNRGPTVNIVIWVGFAVSTIFVLLRLYTRSFITRKFGWDDGLMSVTLLVNFALTVLTSVGCIANGLGRHMEYVQPDKLTSVLFYSAIIQPFGVFCFTTPKLAVAILIVNIMGPAKRGKWFLYGICVVLFLVATSSVIVLFAQCNPTSHLWHPAEPAKCISPVVLQDVITAVAAWSAFVDLCLAVFPITIFWDLKMKKGKKITMSILMGVGVFAMACALIKITTLHVTDDPDYTYAFPDLVIWTLVEIDVVLVAACVPVMPRLLKYVKSKGKNESNPSTFNLGYQEIAKSKKKSDAEATLSEDPSMSTHDERR